LYRSVLTQKKIKIRLPKSGCLADQNCSEIELFLGCTNTLVQNLLSDQSNIRASKSNGIISRFLKCNIIEFRVHHLS
jgi:hypothetical protein